MHFGAPPDEGLTVIFPQSITTIQGHKWTPVSTGLQKLNSHLSVGEKNQPEGGTI